jgi:hypothetical protein
MRWSLSAPAAMPAGAFDKWVVPVRVVVYAAAGRAAADDIFMADLSAGFIFADSMEMRARHTVRVWNWRLGDRRVSSTARADNFMR